MQYLSLSLRHDHYMRETIFEQNRFEQQYTEVNFVKENATHYAGGIVGRMENDIMVKRMQEPHKELLSKVYEAKRSDDLESVFIVEYRRKLNRKHYHPQFNERNEEMTHIEFAWKLKRHLAHQLNTFPGNKHTVFWIEYEDLNNEDENDPADYEFPEIIIYFERQFLGETLQSRLEKCNTTYETKRKWLFEVLEASCELFWHVLYVQLLTEKPLLINQNSCYIDMDPLLNRIFKSCFEERWLLREYPTSPIKPKHLRCNSNKLHIWREFLIDTIFKMFNMQLDATPEELKSGLVWWRLDTNYYSLRDISLYVEVEAFVLLTRIYKSRTLEDLRYIYETSNNNKNKLDCFEILSPEPMKGGIGDVYFVLHKPTKQTHALKIISVENLIAKGFSFEQIKQNVKVTAILDHPNVIKYTNIWFADDDRGLLSATHGAPNIHTEYSYVTNSKESNDDFSVLGYSTCMANSSSSEDYVTVLANVESTSAYEGVPRFLFILMEACKCSLMDKLVDLPANQIVLLKYMNDLLEGVTHIHEEKFMHGDLKPMNALITHDDRLVVADLDTMLTIPDSGKTVTMKQFRTRHYAPPEMSDNTWNEKIDYYALGITFCQMLLGEKHPQVVDEILENGILSNRGIHRQIVFLLRWLTQPSVKHRAGLRDIELIRSLLDVQSVEEFYVTERKFYFTELDGHTVSKRARAVRVAPKFTSIEPLLKRYHGVYKTVRIIEKEEIDRLHNLNWNNNSEWMLDFVDGKVTVVPQGDDYVFILYYDERFNTKSVISKDDHLSTLLANLDKETDSCLDSPVGKIITKTGITSEPDVLRVLPDELLNSDLTLFWSPERLSGTEPKQENDSFACGLLCLRQLCNFASEEDICAATRQLQKGETPVLLETLSRSQVFLINILCAYDPAYRTRVKNLRSTNAQQDGAMIDMENLYSQNFIKNGVVYAMIVSVADDKTTQQVFANKLANFPSVKFLPEELINSWPPINFKTKNMLTVDETSATLVEVPRDDNALTVVVELPGEPFDILWQKKFALCEKLSQIERFFLLFYLSSRNKICGSIMLKNARYNETGSYIIPSFTNEEHTCFLKTHYSSPEQVIDGTGSSASDVFSLGVLLYELLCMAYLLEPKLKYEFKTLNDEFVMPEEFPEPYKSLIKLMTHHDPNKRPSAAQVYSKINKECGPIVYKLACNTKEHEFSTKSSNLPGSALRIKEKYGGSE